MVAALAAGLALALIVSPAAGASSVPTAHDDSGSMPSGRVKDQSFTIWFAGDGATLYLLCAIDGGDFGYCGGSSGITGMYGLADGPHSFAVREVDGDGNVSDTATWEWTVDTRFTYSLSDTAATVTGCNGACPSQLDIPATINGLPVTAIGDAAFGNQTGITSISIPEGVTSIGISAFDGVSGVTNLTIPSSVTSMGRATFQSMHDLATVTFADGSQLTTIPESAFRMDPNLTGVTVPASVTTIEPFAFYEAGSLASVNFQGDAPSVGDNAFGSVADGAVAQLASVTLNGYGVNGSLFHGLVVAGGRVPPATPTAHDDSGSMPSGAVRTQSFTIRFSGDGADGSHLECATDGGDFRYCGGASGLTGMYGLADGPHSFAVREIDAYGTSSATSTYSWIVDTVAPDAPGVTSPTSADTAEGADVPFSASVESGAGLICSLDGGEWAACPAARQGAGDGSLIDVGWGTRLHWGEASDWTDMAWGQINPGGGLQWNGSWQRELFSQHFGSDTVTPESFVGLASMMLGFNLPCEFIHSIGEDPGIYLFASLPDRSKYSSYRVDCANQLQEVPSPSAATFTGLSAGAHTLSVKAVDPAGNQSGPTNVSWSVVGPDTTAPAAPRLTGAPSGVVNTTTASITFSGEDGASFTCSVDGGDYEACGDSPKTLIGLAEGDHGLSVKATDAAGNTSVAAAVSWVVDTTAPSAPRLDLVQLGAAAVTGVSVSFSGEDGATFECSVDGADYSGCASPLVLSGLAPGDHSLSVRQKDAAGNASDPASASWTVARVVQETPDPPGAPTAHDDSGSMPSGAVRTQSFTIRFSGDGASGSHLECARDGGDFEYCGDASGITAMYGLADGPHSFAVREIDSHGQSSDASTYSWVVDRSAPDAPTVTTNLVAVGVVRPSIGFTSAETGGSLECRLDGSAWATCDSPFAPTADLAAGNHDFQVRQTDAAGNVSNAASFDFEVIVPVVTPPQPFTAVTYPTAPSWYMVGRTGHWQIKVPVSNGGDARGASQPLTIQISTLATPDPKLPSRTSRNVNVLRYSAAFTWNHTWKMRPRWVRVGTAGGKWTAWTAIVPRSKP